LRRNLLVNHRLAWPLLGVLCLVLLGATNALSAQKPRLRIEKTYTIDAQSLQILGVDGPARQQKVSVTVEPGKAGVSAYLVKEADENTVTDALVSDKAPPASLLLAHRVSKDRPEKYTIKATIPAKTGYSLILKTGTKTTSVKFAIIGD